MATDDLGTRQRLRLFLKAARELRRNATDHQLLAFLNEVLESQGATASARRKAVKLAKAILETEKKNGD